MIYCVMCSEDFGEGSYLTAIFKNKKKAEKYVEIQNELEQDNGYNYYINEKEFYDKNVSMKTKVASYYNYYINLDEEFCLKECDENNESWEGTEKQRYTCKNYVEVSETCVSGYSVESYEKAREIALNEYYIINDMEHKARRYKVIRGLFCNAELKKGSYNYFQCVECDEVRLKEHFDENFICDNCRNKYLPYDTTTCPICGGKIKHPYTGQVTDEQLQEDIDTCQLIEVIDENDNTLGYEAICKHE